MANTDSFVAICFADWGQELQTVSCSLKAPTSWQIHTNKTNTTWMQQHWQKQIKRSHTTDTLLRRMLQLIRQFARRRPPRACAWTCLFSDGAGCQRQCSDHCGMFGFLEGRFVVKVLCFWTLNLLWGFRDSLLSADRTASKTGGEVR